MRASSSGVSFGVRSGIAVLAVFALGGAALAGQPRPAAQQGAAPAPPPALAPYRVGYTSQDTTNLMAVQPGGSETSALGAGSNVDFDASANGTPARASTGLVWVSNRTPAPGAGRHDGQLWFQARGGESPTQLTGNGPIDQAPALSPDGQRVAFAAEQAGQPGVTNIWVIGTNGTGLRQLTNDGARDTWPTWSPDGTRIAFSSTKDDPAGDIYTMPVAGGAATRVTTDPAADGQPAWSPDGTRIAFTTTRFHPTGDVALVAATGGAVTQAIPGDPGDSAEPAWSADGTRIAFSTHRAANPLGAVFQVVLATNAVSVVAADPGLGDTHPTWLRIPAVTGTAAVGAAAVGAAAVALTDEVVFTQLHGGSSADVFSADASGQDRHDLTNNPGIDDTDPAFSSDGTRMAYTEQNGEDESRVMVANADGSDPHRLTTAAPGSGSESNPAFSPDGSMIALARSQGEAGSVVQIVRVADGQLLGQIPAPPQLSTSDIQPTWSPDGTRIALQRSAFRTQPDAANISPVTVSREGAQGGSFSVDEIVHTPKVPANPDILILLDTTASMGDAIAGAEQDMLTVVDQIRAQQPGAQFGVATFRDVDADGLAAGFNVGLQPTTIDTPDKRTQIQQALQLTAGGGGDDDEDWLYALHQVATGAVNFRPDATKMVVLISDAPSHDPSPNPAGDPREGDPFTPPVSEQDTTNALTAAGIRVIGVPILHASGLVADGGLDGHGQATRITQATNGVLVPAIDPTASDNNPQPIATAITSGISDIPVTVTPVVTHCDANVLVTFDPAGTQTVAGGVDAQFTETVRLDPDAVIGTTLGCTVEFRLNGEATVRPGYTETISVRVTDPALPVVALSDIVADATSAAGAVVNYSASATDSAGNPLTPTCRPPSGGTFPVGVTTVTCTATDAAGNTGSATATITVLPANFGETGIWVATLSPQPDGQIAVPDQIDLSVRLGAPCTGGSDLAPDWSPDGTSLAFAHQGGICVAGADGGNARRVDQGTDEATFLTDPAWSPDGKLIAFNDSPDGGAPRIFTVPAAGGQPTVLIGTPGGASQPAFQRQSDLGVTATANPASVAFNARTTLQFVVTNRGSVPAPNARLTLALPAGLRAEQFATTQGSCDLATTGCAFGALAPGQAVTVRLVATGVAAGPQVVTATVLAGLPDANPQDDTAQVTVTVAAPVVVPPPGRGDLSVLTGVGPNPAFVGGDAVVVTYTVRNAGSVTMPAVALTTTLPAALGKPTAVSPAGCRADGTGCDLGVLQPNQTVQVRIVLAAVAAVNGTESGTVTTTGPDSDPTDNTARASIVVRQPVLTVDPPIGPQGFVVHATGTGFPPGATVRLTWSPGISPAPGLVRVRSDGTIDAQVLVFHHDQLGTRNLVATSAGGTAFGSVSSQPFLVVPSGVEPPFVNNPN